MPYVDQCSFRVDEFMPSLNQIKETFFGDDRYTYEGSFDDCYKRNFSDFWAGRYLRVNTWEYALEGNYESTGEFICKIIHSTEPVIGFKKSLFSGTLKCFQYTPGQIIIEFPNGKQIPIYANDAIVLKPSMNHRCYRVTQPYSREFVDVCNKHDHVISGSGSKYITFHVYKSHEQEELLCDLKRINERAKTYKKETQVQSVDTTSKKNLTENEILNIWREMD